jgi:hypothetical protein
MANSYIEYSTAGTGTNGLGQNQFSYADIDVLSADDIKCKGYAMSAWQDVPVSNQGALTNSTTKKITLTASDATAYSKVRVYRSTTSNALVDFVDGARLTESDLDTAYKQGLFVAQEVAENASTDGASGVANLTANNLADSFYKEGVFTVTATPAGSEAQGTVTLHTDFNTLSYTKIGNRVFVSGKLKVGSVSGSPDGALNLTTLPYTSASLSDEAGASISVLNAQNPTSANIDDITGWINENSTTLSLYYVETSDAASTTGNSIASKMQANTEIYISLNYVTAS